MRRKSLLHIINTFLWPQKPYLSSFLPRSLSELSVAVSRPHGRVVSTNYPIHCLGREKKPKGNSLQISSLSRTRAAEEDQASTAEYKDVSGMWELFVSWWSSESRHRWVKEGGTQKNSNLIINFWLWMEQVSGNWFSCMVLQQSADHPLIVQFLHRILRLTAAHSGSWRLATDYWVIKYLLSLWII